MTLEESIVSESMKTYTALITKEDDTYIAKCPEIGTVSQGQTIEEAVSNLKEATTLYLEEFPEKHSSKPVITTFEVKTVAQIKKTVRKRMH